MPRKKKQPRSEAYKAADKRYTADKKHVWIHADLDAVLMSGEYGASRIEASRNLALILDRDRKQREVHRAIAEDKQGAV